MSENQQYLQELVQKPSVVAWFNKLFKQAHLEITDTGEKFTIIHRGDRAEVMSGFQAEKPNFVIPLQNENIRRLTAAFSNDLPTAQEQYRIVKFMLKPCLGPMLTMPILSNKAILKILKIDTHWQEALLDPQGNEDEQLTVIYINKQWLVIPGYYGKPQRRMVFKPEQVLEFLRRVFEADESGSLAAWVSTTRWYVKWREEITVPV